MQKSNMTMFLIGTAIFILCSYVGQIHCGSSMQQVSVHVNQSCGPTETECAFGCCPYADAVCCIDGFECCQHGQTCIPIIGICVGAVNNNGQMSLTSKKSTRVRSSILKCPPAWTECGPDGCCRYEQGVCCSDGQHCCPNGYRTMFLIGTATFILCFYAGQIQCGSPLQTLPVHVNQSCESYETECALGCCPYADAVCCIDGFECCQHGYVCIPFLICIKAVNSNGQMSLTSKKSTLVRSPLFKCPPGTTECGPNRCCLYKQGVCCSDGQHCCPNGYRCDVKDRKCIKEGGGWSGGAVYKHLRKMGEKSPYKSCPGGSRMCPSYMSCCMNDNGSWGCCPNPSLPEIGYGNGECCGSIFGNLCCPDDLPTCTLFGCTK